MVASAIKQQIKEIDEGLAEFSESEKKEFGSKLIAKKEELQKQLKELEDAEKAAAKPAPTPEKKKEAKKEVVKEVKQSKELVKKTSKILHKLKEKVKQAEPKKPIKIIETAKAKAVAPKKVVEPKKAQKVSSAAIDRARKIAMKYRKKQNISTAKSDLEKDAQRAALPMGKRISKEGNVYYENRENRTDRNPKKYPRLEEGGDVSGEHHYKVNLKYWVADVYEDNYEEGEGSHVNSFDGKVHKTFEFVDDLIRYISTNILYKDVSKEDFDIQDGVMSTSLLVDEANIPATDSEIELWKEDEINLYSANYSFYVQLVQEKEATEEELREMLGLQGGGYSSMFKEGSQVKTTVFMSTEDIGGDEDIEVGTIGVVMTEPMDDEQLVQVQLNGSMHYLPQDVLEVVSGEMMAKGGFMYEKLNVSVQGVGQIYYGNNMVDALRAANDYLSKHPNSEITIIDEKYGDEYDLQGNQKEYAKGGSIDADRYAKPSGWRWKDIAVEDGIINRASLSHSPSEKMRKQYPDYVAFENRADKSDKKPSRKYQSLAHGGTLGKNGLEYALHSIVTDDTIGALTNMHNKKEIESVKHTAIEILERDGDREYTMANLKDVLLQAKDGHFKSGGMFKHSRPKSAIARDRKYTSQQEWEKDYVRKASPRLTYREGKYEGGGEIGETVIVELNNGRKIEGTIEKLNPLKIRTSPSDTMVLPNSLIKSMSKKMSYGGEMHKNDN